MSNEGVEKKELPSYVSLSKEESLEYQNIQLQRQIVAMQGVMINKQEVEWIKKIHGRTGMDVSGWNINIENGTCTSMEKEKKS